MAPLHEAELTGSMISNYVKKDIIDNPIKKQYGREQIATLIFIAVAKIVLSLEDINELLKLQRQVCDTQTAYNYFREEFPKVLEAVFDNRELGVVPETSESDIANIKRLCRNVSITTAYKVYLDMSFANHRSAEATNK